MNEILIIADSRGTGLKTHLIQHDKDNRLRGCNVTVTILRGADLDNGFERLAREIDTHNTYDIIYVMLGVNNLMVKNLNKKVTPVYSDLPTLIEMTTVKFEIFKYQLCQMSENIVLCQLIGMNLKMYNRDEVTFTEEQTVIDEAMPLLLHTLNLINAPGLQK